MTSERLSITVTHLYPKELNLYGDSGNIKVLKKRAEWRGIEVIVNESNIGDSLDDIDTDIYFMGGGQDKDQADIVDDFASLKYSKIKSDTEDMKVFLGVCGGYQLMGERFITGDGQELPGLSIIPIETRAPSLEVNVRCIGNLIAKIEDKTYEELCGIYDSPIQVPQTLVGFENHSGQTHFISEEITPLAKPIAGFGNNISQESEGARFGNIFGSYMHGPLLPKNPHFADLLIALAVRKKYQLPDFTLTTLDDTVELNAHQFIKENYA